MEQVGIPPTMAGLANSCAGPGLSIGQSSFVQLQYIPSKVPVSSHNQKILSISYMWPVQSQVQYRSIIIYPVVSQVKYVHPVTIIQYYLNIICGQLNPKLSICIQ